AISFALRIVRLGSPSRRIFDEVYYVRDACWYFVHRVGTCEVGRELNLEHPPLGKALIGLGIRVFGVDAFGWRFASAVFGVVFVVVTYLLARKLLASTAAACFAGGLACIDFLAFVHSRIAMLDIFLATFIAAAFLFALYDRDEALGRRTGKRWWRIAAGAAAGCALATKWSGLIALVSVVILTVAWDMHRRRRPRRSAFLKVVREEGRGMLVAFLVVPLAVYVASFIGHVHGALWALPWHDGSWVYELYQRQIDALHYHLSLGSTNPFQSSPWSWLLLKRAFPYFTEVTSSGQRINVLGGGSPVTWWLAIPALLWVTVQWFRRNDPARPEGFIVAGFWLNLLPWMAFEAAPFLLGSGRTGLYIFYVLPMIPFMCAAQALAAQRLWAYLAGRIAVVVVAVAAAAVFAFYYPMLTAMPLSERAWDARIWIFDHCTRPDTAPLTVYNIKTVHGELTTKVSTIGRQFLPPEGWCWKAHALRDRKIPLGRMLHRTD
ncbi:MAG TPA: phospholipid carrier-dependent glycosyltransferase, partial [Actinomycetota bacterium]|nr:phospholipid carrier-dependent glycosyltransferase [Actinomycetota bacterium]